MAWCGPTPRCPMSPSTPPTRPTRTSRFPPSLERYTFGAHQNGHYICKVCGCEIFERDVDKEGTAEGTMGLNLMLLNDIGEWFDEAQGLFAQGKEKPKGPSRWGTLERSVGEKEREPKYALLL